MAWIRLTKDADVWTSSWLCQRSNLLSPYMRSVSSLDGEILASLGALGSMELNVQYLACACPDFCR